MAAAARALWCLIVSVVSACALISREGTGMARVTKTPAKVTQESAQLQVPDTGDEEENEDAGEEEGDATDVDASEENEDAGEEEGDATDVDASEAQGNTAGAEKLNAYKKPLAACGEGDYCSVSGQHLAICLTPVPLGWCFAVNTTTDECMGSEGKPACVPPGALSYFADEHPAPELDCNALPDGLFGVPLAAWKKWNGEGFPEQELDGLRAIYQHCNVTAGEDEVGTFKEDFCGFATRALSHYDGKGEEKAHQHFSACKPAGTTPGFDYEPIEYKEEPLKLSHRGLANVYGQPLAVCGSNDIDCETGGEDRAICLKKMPEDYCDAVGLADTECEDVQGVAWCVSPGSYSLYVSTHEAPGVECSAIPDGLFTLPMDSWKEFKSTKEFDQELNGLKALYKQCDTPSAKTKFKKSFCEFAPAALAARDEKMKADEPFSDCFRQIKRKRRRIIARSIARGLKRLARRFTSS